MPNKRIWETDGITLNLYADDALTLQLPLAILSTAPQVLVGKDPATGLPCFCPPPENAAMGATAIPPTTAGDCPQMRCGAALSMTQRLYGLYKTWQLWINAALAVAANSSVALVLAWIGALIEGLILAERVASWVLTVFSRIKPLLSALTLTEMGTVLPSWDPTTVDNVQRVFYCALQCTDSFYGSVSVSAADMTNVAGYIRTHTSAFLGDIVSEILAASCEFATLADWQAVVSGATPSPLCAGYTCV